MYVEVVLVACERLFRTEHVTEHTVNVAGVDIQLVLLIAINQKDDVHSITRRSSRDSGRQVFRTCVIQENQSAEARQNRDWRVVHVEIDWPNRSDAAKWYVASSR